MPPPQIWPHFDNEAQRFYKEHMKRPRSLFAAFVAKGPGSGRRAGPRDLQWQAVTAFAVAALEAGLEDLLFAAHAARRGVEGQTAVSGTNSVDARPKKWLVEERLMAPGARKIERVLFADFGLLLGPLPSEAHFEVRTKKSSKGGSGRGEAKPGPTTWAELGKYVDCLAYIRNATAHGDATKLGESPKVCEGSLWLEKENGTWSVQQPHALTALRTVLATFNLVAVDVATELKRPVPRLTDCKTLDYPK